MPAPELTVAQKDALQNQQQGLNCGAPTHAGKTTELEHKLVMKRSVTPVGSGC